VHRATQAKVVDNNSDPHDIVCSFVQNIGDLYNSVSYSRMDMMLIDHELANRINHIGLNDT
jgi:hypothetical protein